MATNWIFSKKQAKSITDSQARINLWEGSVRSGKTIASIIRWLDYIRTAPPGALAMIGKTERTLKRNILDEIERIVGRKHFKYNRGTGEAKIFGRVVHIVGANDERSEGKIRGMTLAGSYGDEITLWPESFFRQLMLRHSVRGSKFFGTTNPDSPYHWLKTDYIDKAHDLDMRVFHFQLDDNLALDPSYVEALKKEYTGLWYKRFILGLWVMAQGAIYDIWDENKHTFEQLPDGQYDYQIWCDYGTHNPCVFLLVAKEMRGYLPRYWVLKEYYWNSRETGRQKTDREYALDLILFCKEAKIKPSRVIVDPSAASFIVQLNQHRFPVVEAENEVLDGIRKTYTALKDGRLKVHKTCRNTIKEFGSYVWDEKSQKLGMDKPLKENDHAMDALRYGIMTQGMANIRVIEWEDDEEDEE